MISKDVYLDTKRWVKCLCRTNLKQLCEDMELTEYEKKLIIGYHNGDTVVSQCMNLNISKGKYTNDLKLICTKIYNYKSTL